MVRAAVLKNKDPSQILEEMEKIDEMGELVINMLIGFCLWFVCFF